MAGKQTETRRNEAENRPAASNVKTSGNYERFGETIRYLTLEEWQAFQDAIDHYKHKLMMRLIYELGCRVGEFTRIRLCHVDFARARVVFPAENTKTRRRRVCHAPLGLMNEIKSWLKQSDRMSVRQERVMRPEQFLFSPRNDCSTRYSENRLRQVFLRYARLAGLDRDYGVDRRGRRLHELTIHSLRHSHVMHYVHAYKLPIAVVQKQVGHTSLKTTSVYLNPSSEAVAEAYRAVHRDRPLQHHNP